VTTSAREATIADASIEPFSTQLREGTREEHERAESTGFVSAYLAGRVPLEGFAALQGQLWFVYEALESAAPGLRRDPVVGPFLDPRLDRLASLDADLRTLLGATWRERVRPGEAARSHAARIGELARSWPAGYLAHHYLRYLGDLSGGRALGHKARTTYHLDGDGARFYQFEGIASAREFKDAYRRRLDEAPWSADERERIVEEARVGFRLSGALFAELERAFPVGVAV
jgi:heme oxygenase